MHLNRRSGSRTLPPSAFQCCSADYSAFAEDEESDSDISLTLWADLAGQGYCTVASIITSNTSHRDGGHFMCKSVPWCMHSLCLISCQ